MFAEPIRTRAPSPQPSPSAPTPSASDPSGPHLPPHLHIRSLLRAAGLSPQECNVVLLDYSGLARQEIAQQLQVAPATIKTYWQRIYAKLGICQRSQLRRWLHIQGNTPDWQHSLCTPDVLPIGGQDCPLMAD